MIGAVEAVGATEGMASPKSASAFGRVFDAVQSQENRLQSNLTDQMGGNKERAEFTQFLDQTFERLQGQFTDPMQKQTFEMVRSEMTAANERNSEFIASKIESGMKNIQLELALKATSKTGQGLQQLLSSQ